MNNRYWCYIILLCLITGCSPGIDTFYNRWSQPVFTRFNVMFNGEQALQKGKSELDVRYQENFFQILPVEAILENEEIKLNGQENALFERAEQKAIKAIQRHSMVVNGVQKNHRIDDAYLLLGKSRYYNQRYVAALEAFTHIIHNYPQSDRLGEVAIWREKTNLRLGKDEIAMKGLIKLIDSLAMPSQVESEARATLAQSLINLNRYTLAVHQLEKAASLTRKKPLKGRYLFIAGQLNELLNFPAQAEKNYRSVLDLNWSIPRILWVEALLGVSRTSSFSSKDREKFAKYLAKVTTRYEHRDFQDILYYAQAELFKVENRDKAVAYYEKSIKKNTLRPTLKMMAHKTVAEIYFDKKDYLLAYNHYNQAYLLSENHSLEQLYLKRKRDNLYAVADLEGKVKRYEQILSLKDETDAQRLSFYDKYIKDSLLANNSSVMVEKQDAPKGFKTEHFYFHNPVTVMRGIQAFQKKWGVFELQDNWRKAPINSKEEVKQQQKDTTSVISSQENQAQIWLTTFPETSEQWLALSQDKNQMLYKLGEIYSTQFKDDDLAVQRWEQLYADTSEEILKKKTYYQLHKAYQRLYNANKTSNLAKAMFFDKVLNEQFPLTSQVIEYEKQYTNTEEKQKQIEQIYDNVRKHLLENDYRSVLQQLQQLHFDSPFQNRIEFLLLAKARAYGRLYGITYYEKELQSLKKLYKDSEYSAKIDSMLIDLAPLLKDNHFISSGKSWKIIVRGVSKQDMPKFKDVLKSKIHHWDRTGVYEISEDVYNQDEDWIVLHDIPEKSLALSLLKNCRKEFGMYQWIPISYNNYMRVQRFKNIENYERYLNDNPIDF